MRKDSVDDNHSYQSISTPRRHFETLVRTCLIHYKLENWLSIYFRDLFRGLIHFIMHAACYVRRWWRHVRQRKSVYTQCNKKHWLFRVLERVRYFEKGTSIMKSNLCITLSVTLPFSQGLPFFVINSRFRKWICQKNDFFVTFKYCDSRHFNVSLHV